MLIFGGTGFIGRHVCQALFAAQQKATVVSRAPDTDFVANLAPFIDALTLKAFGEVRDQVLARIDTIIYAASQSVPHTFVGRPWCEYEQNVAPAIELFSRALQLNPGVKIVFISSGGTVYGSQHSQPIKESALIEPISPYGLGKAAIEHGLEFLGRTAGLNYCILRVSNPFGQWQNNPKQGIIPIAINAILNRQPITVYGGGTQIRDFIDADDLAQGILLAARSESCKQVILNMGSGKGVSICEVFGLLQDILGQELMQEQLAARDSDVPYSVLDCKRAKEVLNWEAQTQLSESIHKFLAHKGISVARQL